MHGSPLTLTAGGSIVRVAMTINREGGAEGQSSPFWFALMFVGIGVLCLVAGVVNYIREEAFFTTAEEETATLVKYVPDPNPKVADFCPRYQFTTKAGETINYVGEECLSKPDASRIGRQEKVYIDPKVPQIVESKGWLGSEGSGLIMGVAGLVFFSLIGLIQSLITRARDRRRMRQA